MDPSTALEYFQIIPLIEKIPKLYEIAMNDFARYDNSTQFVQGGNQNPFAIFGSVVGPLFGGMTGMGMGYMNQPQGYFNQQPVAPQQYGAPAQFNPQANPMYGQYQQQPAQGFYPQQPGFQQQPVQNGYQPQVQGYQPQQQAAQAPQQAEPAQQPAQEAPAQADKK